MDKMEHIFNPWLPQNVQEHMNEIINKLNEVIEQVNKDKEE